MENTAFNCFVANNVQISLSKGEFTLDLVDAVCFAVVANDAEYIRVIKRK